MTCAQPKCVAAGWGPSFPLVVLALLPFFLFSVNTASADSVSFRNDVMAVLSKYGCNQGACHGNANGKNGFKLSLRGEDPEWDIAALTRDALGRRINRQTPASSLVLLKATGSVPHEGGRRFDTNSPEYKLFMQWIADGAVPDHDSVPLVTDLVVHPTEQVLFEPANTVQLRVQASFSDGSMRDVTRLACYEPSNQLVFASPEGQIQANQPGEASILVRYSNQQVVARFAFVPARPNFQWPNISAENFVDRRVFNKLSALRLVPANLCLDSVFLRRAYLDCLGLLPTASDVQGFLSDNVPDKRARLIDDLLGRPEFAEFWALKWSDLLRNEEKTLDRKGVQAFHRWIRQSIADGKPLNEFARELIAARGSTYTNPPANYYRANRNALVRAETTAQIFMGIRLQCAKCHNHPFDRWTMDDYYSLTAFFARVQYKIVENNRRDGLDQHEFDGEQIVWMDRDGEVQNPRTGTRAAPRFPAIAATASPQLPPEADRLAELADWIARPDNPFFARAQVNRIWFHLMGRGIVEPIDDFRASNPAANPGLLEALASDFIEHGFDLRHCVRTIMNSRTYQLSAIPNDSNRDDTENFSRALVRPMQAEVLLDAVSQVTGVPAKFTGYPIGVRAGALPGVMVARRRESSPSPADEFLKLFGKPERLLACECERSDETTLGQAFQLISGETINHMLTSSDGRLSRLLENGRSNEDIINEFYLASLSRPPTEGEARTALEFVGRSPDRRAALEDLVWGLVNAKEFLLRQ